jgi:magnesium transporter
LRSELLLLRRSLWPQREAIAALMREEHHQITAETRIYLRDVYDHVVQLIDVTETYREVCADLRDLYYARISQRTNDVMRVLTIIATLFMPLSFIAGLYGMNFQPEASPYNMPELRMRFGYPSVVLVMVVVAMFMLTFFYRRGWLSRSN